MAVLKKKTNNLNIAFKALRKAGYFARQNFWCCQSCAWNAIDDDKTEKVVFYHRQDNANKVEGKPFHLGWCGDGHEICRILNENNIKTNWDGSNHTRIEIVSW